MPRLPTGVQNWRSADDGERRAVYSDQQDKTLDLSLGIWFDKQDPVSSLGIGPAGHRLNQYWLRSAGEFRSQ